MRNKLLVAPLAGAWIEMRCNIARFCACIVAPLAGAWIEISAFRGSRLSIASLPSRERGLKSVCYNVYVDKWMSLPSRERGLKYGYGQKRNVRGAVAPLAGAWIEIPSIKEGEQMAKRRSPRGSVD